MVWRKISTLPLSEDISCVMPSHTLSVQKDSPLFPKVLFPIRPLLSYNEYISHKRKALWEKGRGGGREVNEDKSGRNDKHKQE